MQQHYQAYARKKRQLRYVGKQLMQLRAAGQELPKTLVARFRRLVKQLTPRLGTRGLQRTLGAAALFLGLGYAAQAQLDFEPAVNNPFGIVGSSVTAYYNIPVLADLDDDGDLDLLQVYYTSDNYADQPVVYQENIGTAEAPLFGPQEFAPFNLVIPGYFVYTFNMVDMDDDGDLDILGSVYDFDGAYRTFYTENTGTAVMPNFATPQLDPFGFPVMDNVIPMPSVGDLDDDGDLDIMLGSFNADTYLTSFSYYENTGTATTPVFNIGLDNPVGLTPNTTVALLHRLADLDDDGDLDLLSGGYDTNTYTALFYFYENTGTENVPDFAAPVSNIPGLNFLQTEGIFFYDVGDLDDDGDLDLLASDYYGGLNYYENNLITVGTQEQAGDFALTLAPNPTTGETIVTTTETIERIEVSDMTGRRVLTYVTPTPRIDLGSLVPGSYMVKLVTDDQRFVVRRLQKQ